MCLAMEMARHTAEQPESASTSHESDTTEVDLDRLVWDPEYRAAMRPLLRHDA